MGSEKSQFKKSDPNSERLNSLLDTQLSKVNKALISLQSEHKDASANQIKKDIYHSDSNQTFFELADEHLGDLENSEKLNRLSSDKALIGYILKFYKSKHLTFQEIDERFLKKLMIYLKSSHKLSEPSIMNIMVLVRLLYNRAIKQKIVIRDLYPFGSDKIRIKFPESNKIGLNIQEIRNIEGLNNLTSVEIHTRNVWLFSFNFAGMIVSDVLKIRWSDINDNRLQYRVHKNSKLISMKIPMKALEIINFYRDGKINNNDFLFPEMKKANLNDAKDVFNKLKTANRKFNTNLKSIAR